MKKEEINKRIKTIKKDINKLILGDFKTKYIKNGCFESEQEAENFYWQLQK